MTYRLTSFFYNAAIFSIITMYMNLIPLNVETKPVLLICFSLFIWAFRKESVFLLTPVEFFTFIFICVVILNTVISFFTYGAISILDGAKYLFGPFVFLTCYRALPYITVRTLLLVLSFLVFYLVISMTIGEDFARKLFILPTRNGTDRPTMFTPEPSYFANTFVFFICLTHYLKYKYKFVKSKNNLCKYTLKFSPIVLIILAVFTMSAYLFLFILIYLSCLIYSKNKETFIKLVVYCSLFLVLFVFAVINGPPTRMQHVLNIVSEVMFMDVPFEVLLYGKETSGSTRLILNYIAFLAPVENSVFGFGVGGFSQEWVSVAKQLELPIHKHELLKTERPFAAPTYLANLVSDIGVSALFILPVLFLGNFKNKENNADILFVQVFTVTSLILFFFFQSQITNPIPWLMLIFLKKSTWNINPQQKVQNV